MNKKTYTTPWGRTIDAYAREGTIDENTLISCLIEDEYHIGDLPQIGTAIDLGTHVGGASLALLSRGFEVIGVEMLPENQEMTEKNVRLNAFPCHLYYAAIGKDDDKTLIAQYEGDGATRFNGSLLERKNNSRSIEVQTISLPRIFEENALDHCDFLKVDIEGSEWDVFRSLPPQYLDKIDRIAVEIHRYESVTSTQEFSTLLGEKFVDVSKEYFPIWSKDGEFVHGYFIRKAAL